MQCLSVVFHRVQQIVNIDPATVIEPDPDQLRPVPEQEAEEFARFFPERQSLLGGGILSFQLAQISFRISSEAASSGSLQPACCDVGAHRLPAGPIDSGQIAGGARWEVTEATRRAGPRTS